MYKLTLPSNWLEFTALQEMMAPLKCEERAGVARVSPTRIPVSKDILNLVTIGASCTLQNAFKLTVIIIILK